MPISPICFLGLELHYIHFTYNLVLNNMNVLITFSRGGGGNQRTKKEIKEHAFKITDLKDEGFSCVENNDNLTQII
jgi:hypothetical protein